MHLLNIFKYISMKCNLPNMKYLFFYELTSITYFFLILPFNFKLLFNCSKCQISKSGHCQPACLWCGGDGLCGLMCRAGRREAARAQPPAAARRRRWLRHDPPQVGSSHCFQYTLALTSRQDACKTISNIPNHHLQIFT